MLTEKEQDLILKELGGVLHETLKELPHLRSFKQEGTALMYVCTEFGQCSFGPLTISGWGQRPG
jgi:hypothetical protein